MEDLELKDIKIEIKSSVDGSYIAAWRELGTN